MTKYAWLDTSVNDCVSGRTSWSMFDFVYVVFPGEYQGFDKPENKKYSLEAEFYFFSQVLDFTPADKLPQVSALSCKHPTSGVMGV